MGSRTYAAIAIVLLVGCATPLPADPAHDPDHCGEVGVMCSPTEACVDGRCVATGAMWATPDDRFVVDAVLDEDGIAYVIDGGHGTSDALRALDDAGRERWSVEVSGGANGLLLGADGDLYLAGGQTRRFDRSGRLVWTSPVVGNVPIVEAADLLIVGHHPLVAVHRDGTLAWRDGPPIPMDRAGDYASALAVNRRGRLFVRGLNFGGTGSFSSYSSWTREYEPATGHMLWSDEYAFRDATLLLGPDDQPRLPAPGSVVDLEGIVATGPAVAAADGSVYEVADHELRRLVHGQTTSALALAPPYSHSIRSLLLSSTGIVYVVELLGRLRAIRTRAYGGLAASSWPSAFHDNRNSCSRVREAN